MLNILDNMLHNPYTLQIAGSAALIALAWAAKLSADRWVRRADIKSHELRRRWLIQIRNAAYIIIASGLIAIWATEIRSVALSVAAIFVALVLATKELILCFTGGIFKVSSHSFSLGDRISIQGLRGEVIDQTLLSTKILEIGPGDHSHQATTRQITLPNSLFLSNPVINESFIEGYTLHTFTVPITAQDHWQQAEKCLLHAANEVCAPYSKTAKKHILKQTLSQALDTPSLEPRVTLYLPDPGRIDLIVRVLTPTRGKGQVEQDILRKYLEAMPTPPPGDTASSQPLSSNEK